MAAGPAETAGPTQDRMAATTSSNSVDALWQRFAAKAIALGAEIERVADSGEASRLLAERAGDARGAPGLSERFGDVAASLRPLDDSEPGGDVVGYGRFAVAETGSVVLGEQREGRRASFLSEHLWLLVPAEEIVPALDDGLDRLARLVAGGNHYLTIMSGPSRTADIERTLTIGVHGPASLSIVVVG